MRPPRALLALPFVVLATVAASSCASDGTGAGSDSALATGTNVSTVDSGTMVGSSSAGRSADTVDGPTLDDLVQATLDQGTARYLLVAESDSGVSGLLGTLPATNDTSSAAGCDATATDRLEYVVDFENGLRCITLPDASRLIVDDRTISLERDGVWTNTLVQFDAALALLSSDQLIALHDPGVVLTAVADAASSDAVEGPTQGSRGLEYRAVLTVADLDDPFLAVLAQRAGASTITVTLLADDAGNAVRGLVYEFTAAAVTPGAANGDGTGGTTTASSEGANAPVNAQGGGSGNTAPVASSPDSSGSTMPESATFEDVPAVLVGFLSFGDDVSIATPTEAETLNLGDLAGSFEVDLSASQG